MPVLMRFSRLLEAPALPRCRFGPLSQSVNFFEYSINAVGAHSNHIFVQHHLALPAIAFLGMSIEIRHDGLLLSFQQAPALGLPAISA